MRRILILVLILALVGVGAIAVLSSGGGDGDEDETPVVGDGTTTADDTEPTPTPNVVPVVVAVQEINRGQLITADLVDIRFWPEPPDGVAYSDLSSTEQVVGSLARTDIPTYSPIVSAQLVGDPTQLANTGSDLATLLDAQRLAIAVPLDPTGLGQVAYGLQPGDRVDIIMTFAFVDVDETFQTRIPNTVSILAVNADGELTFTPPTLGTPEDGLFELGIIGEDGIVGTAILPGAIGPSEKVQRPRLITQRVISDAEVMYVGWLPDNGRIYGEKTPTPFVEVPTATPVGTPPPDQQQAADGVGTPVPASPTPYTPMIMTLAVSPQDAVVLTWAIESNIPITYALRSANLNEGAVVGGQTTAVTLTYMITTYQIPNPATLVLPYALEPRPAIRRFDLSSLRRFVELQPENADNSVNDPLREDLLREDLFIGQSAE